MKELVLIEVLVDPYAQFEQNVAMVSARCKIDKGTKLVHVDPVPVSMEHPEQIAEWATRMAGKVARQVLVAGEAAGAQRSQCSDPKACTKGLIGTRCGECGYEQLRTTEGQQ